VTLKRGDVCMVIPHHEDRCGIDRAIIGRTVVLIDYYVDQEHKPMHLNPFWKVTGLPERVVGISHQKLQKFPDPPPLADDIPTLDEIVA
jgi:hypothetical protein